MHAAVSRYAKSDRCCVVSALVEGTVKRSKGRVQAHSQHTAPWTQNEAGEASPEGTLHRYGMVILLLVQLTGKSSVLEEK